MFMELKITSKADLYQNGHYKGEFDLEEAIQYACMHDDDDNWTIEEVEE
jgi:hypothetical protein